MSKNAQLEKKVEDFILNHSRDFHFADLAEDPLITKASGFSEKALLDLLETNSLVFSRDFNTFKPRHLFFKNARFIISPTEEETKNRLLIPGHRFIPFCFPRMYPWQCSLQAGEIPVPQKNIQKNVASLFVYYTLFGQENLPSLLIMDQPANETIFGSSLKNMENAIVTVTAFDFTALFRQWNFSFGDGLLLEVKDWIHGVFSVEYLPRKRRQELMTTSAEWIAKLEKGFLKTFDDLGLEFPLEEQIAYAYYYAGTQILKEPPLHLGGFLDSSSRVNIVTLGMETRLWHETRVDSSALGAGIQESPTGATGSLDAIFEDLHVALTEIEVEAYMRDELFRRKENPDTILERLSSGRGISFFSENQMNDFNRYFKKLWNKVKKRYNYFTDQLPGKARNRILDLLDSHYAWMQSLEACETRENDLPLQEIAGLSQAVAFLVENLKLLNQKSAGQEEEIKESIELLPQIEQLLDDLHQEITDKLETLPRQETDPSPEKRRQGLYLVKPETKNNTEKKSEEEKTGSIYVLRISLLDITPAVWRIFQIPGGFPLSELHTIIQDVMGWEGYHSHSFQAGGRLYGPATDEVFDFGLEEIDENDITLEELNLKEKQKFQYTYDFGDTWLHQITVMKILPAGSVPMEETVLCLDGKRACPPEDCGGAPGYQDILEALKSPNEKKNRELLDWLGEYDPEAFDISAINEILTNHI